MYNNTLDDEALNSHSFFGGVAVCTKGTVIQDNSHAGDQSIAAKKPSHKDRKKCRYRTYIRLRSRVA
jgi:hypothetical protein